MSAAVLCVVLFLIHTHTARAARAANDVQCKHTARVAETNTMHACNVRRAPTKSAPSHTCGLFPKFARGHTKGRACDADGRKQSVATLG